MKRELIAFVSLGFACGGPEQGEYGKFEVELTDEEWDVVDKVANDDNIKGWKRNYLEEHYPEIDEKIWEAGRDLVERVTLRSFIITGREYIDKLDVIMSDIEQCLFAWPSTIDSETMPFLFKKWENWEENWILSKPSAERFDLIKKRGYLDDFVDLDEVCGELCYYLSEKELPSDYKK